MQAVCPAVSKQEPIKCVCAPISHKAMPINICFCSHTCPQSSVSCVYCHVITFPKCLSFIFQHEKKSYIFIVYSLLKRLEVKSSSIVIDCEIGNSARS